MLGMQDAFQILTQALLASFGGLARQLYDKDKKKINTSLLVRACLIAAFIGVLTYFVTKSFEIESNLSFAASGLCGWIGPQIIDYVTEYAIRKSGLKT
ncbi:MAG: phage holin family protein [Clostridiales bacterium]|jgi:hypothetical protein|nr:phage holin family protein [Clostridiales bacterium]